MAVFETLNILSSFFSDTKVYSVLKYELCIEYNLSMGFITVLHTEPLDGLSKRIWSIVSILSSNGVELSLYTLFDNA